MKSDRSGIFYYHLHLFTYFGRGPGGLQHKMIKFDKRFLQRLRVPLGFLFAIIFIVFARPTVLSLLIGGGFALVGLAIRAWASGHIRKAKLLAVSGPYAYTRNPLYVGSFILGVGFTIAAGAWWLA